MPSDLATFKIPTPFASSLRTFRSVAPSIFGRPSFTLADLIFQRLCVRADSARTTPRASCLTLGVLSLVLRVPQHNNRRQFCPCICLIFERCRGRGFLYALYPVLGVKCHGKDRGTHALMAYGHVEEIAT